jgi:hypothetical protein
MGKTLFCVYSKSRHNATNPRQAWGYKMKSHYPYTPRQLQNSRSEFVANLHLEAKHKPQPRYIQRATRHNHTISAALPWIVLLIVVASIGIMLAWRG